jgi:hypothetical protein
MERDRRAPCIDPSATKIGDGRASRRARAGNYSAQRTAGRGAAAPHAGRAVRSVQPDRISELQADPDSVLVDVDLL